MLCTYIYKKYTLIKQPVSYTLCAPHTHPRVRTQKTHRINSKLTSISESFADINTKHLALNLYKLSISLYVHTVLLYILLLISQCTYYYACTNM